MSYYVQHNTQEKSLGVFIVIAFHVLLIWGLINGLADRITVYFPDAIKVTKIQETVVPPTPIDLPNPTIDKKIPVTTIDVFQQPEIVIDQSRDNTFPTTDTPTFPTKINLVKPTLKNATKPEYPSAAARLGEQGATGLSLYISAQGLVEDVKLLSSSGSKRLDDAALKHVKRNWSFSPCVEDGRAVACWFNTKLVWRLEDAAQ